MKEFISNAYQKAVVATGAVLTAAVPAFAEGEPAAESLPQGLDATLLTSYSEAVTENMVSVLKTFAVVVIGFFVYSVLKKALNRSK